MVQAKSEGLGLRLRGNSLAVGAAREWTRNMCAGQPSDRLADLELVVAELVTNAVLHAETDLVLTIDQGDTVVRIEVTDGRSDRLPERVGTGLAGTLTGRGLSVVDSIASAWGVEVDGPAKTVWAELGPDVASGEERGAVHGADRAEEQGGNVRLLAVPARLILASTSNVDDLLREFQIGADEGDELGALAARLVAMTGASREPLRHAAIDTVIEGRRLVDASIPASPEIAVQFTALVEVLERLAQLCREGRLLSMAPSDEVLAFRRWIIDEIARQVGGQPPSVCPFADHEPPEEAMP